MRILLVKLKHIGDTLILTPTIVALKRRYPKAEIWVLVRRDCASILEGCPEIHQVLTVAGVEKNERSPLDLVWQAMTLAKLWRQPFDAVFELGDGHRGRLFSLLARARNRYSVKPASPLKPWEKRRFTGISTRNWETSHRIEKDFSAVDQFLSLDGGIPPLRFARERTTSWEPAQNLTDFAVVQIGSRQGFSRWNKEGWRDVIRGLLEYVPTVVLTCGPVKEEIKESEWLRREVGADLLPTYGAASWRQMADLLYRARLYVGPSTATLHLAAACECPCVGIFGRSNEDHWFPWRVPYRIVTSPTYVPSDDIQERYARVALRTTDDVRPDDVIFAARDLLGARV